MRRVLGNRQGMNFRGPRRGRRGGERFATGCELEKRAFEIMMSICLIILFIGLEMKRSKTLGAYSIIRKNREQPEQTSIRGMRCASRGFQSKCATPEGKATPYPLFVRYDITPPFLFPPLPHQILRLTSSILYSISCTIFSHSWKIFFSRSSSSQAMASIFQIFFQFISIFCSSCSILGPISFIIFSFLFSMCPSSRRICYRSSRIYAVSLCESMQDCLQMSQVGRRVLAGRRPERRTRSSWAAAFWQQLIQIYNLFYFGGVWIFWGMREQGRVVFIGLALYYYYKTIINGMLNTTFASFKINKEHSNLPRPVPPRRPEHPPTSFKEIREGNLGKGMLGSNKKGLENQENTYFNALQDQFHENTVRKNLIKIDKSRKKVNHTQLYKSPSQRGVENAAAGTAGKGWQGSHYKTKSDLMRNEENLIVFTPSIIKNHSFTRDEPYPNTAFLAAKQNYTESSEKGSVSFSSKASFDDSFQLYPNDVSYEQEDKGRNRMDNVNSSMEIVKPAPTCSRDINDFNKNEREMKTMKKSTHFYCSNLNKEDERILKTEEQVSVSSSVSSNISSSINFTEKFKHYKRHKHDHKPSQSLALDHFQLGRQIGSGKYGKVILARHRASGFICAIKSVPKKIIKQQNLQIPFIRQIKIQMYLNHPNIVKLYGFFHDRDHIHLIMEYCSGSNLLKMIQKARQLDEGEIVSILSNIFEAVSYIHCHGVIHRDLKPENIVIENGVHKLCDFGWAAYACGDSRTTFCGTPLYVCPEVLKGEEYNSKADIWGLGIITYQLVFGRVPFSIINQSDLMKIIKDPVYFPGFGSTSEKLIPFIKGMLTKNPEQRPSLNEVLSSQIFRSFQQRLSPQLRRQLSLLF